MSNVLANYCLQNQAVAPSVWIFIISILISCSPLDLQHKKNPTKHHKHSFTIS